MADDGKDTVPQIDTDLTVAALAECDGRFLFVRERASGRIVLNHPGGHPEARETPEDTVRREVLEETGYLFEPETVLGAYLWEQPSRQRRHLRIYYGGRIEGRTNAALDDRNIVGVEWLSPAELKLQRLRHRYPIVERAVDDYLSGRHRDTLKIERLDELERNIDSVTASAVVV